MDLKILEIASNTENNKVIDNFTHKSKNKNPICGDEMEISLVVKNDTVLDTFLGGGTTLFACKNTNRKFKGCELSKDYFDKLQKLL